MDLAKCIKKFRRQYGLTQVQASQVLDISLGSLRDYEQGRSMPSRLAISALAARIEVYGKKNPKKKEKERRKLVNAEG